MREKNIKAYIKMSSLRYRINILVFFPVSMLMIFLICNNGYAITVVRNKAYEANAEMMNMYMNHVDESFKIMENYWAGLQLSFTFQKLIDYYTEKARLKTDMDNIVQTYSYIDNLFIYVGEKDEYFDAAKYSITTTERKKIKNMIIDRIHQANAEGEIAAEWQCVEYAGDYYLVRMFRNLGIYMGGCVNVSRLLTTMRRDGFKNIDYLTFYENEGRELGHILPLQDLSLEVTGVEKKFSKSINRTKYLIITRPSKCGDFSLVAMMSEQGILGGLGEMQNIIVILGFCIIVFLFAFLSMNQRWILRPVIRLRDAMNSLKNGNFDVRIISSETCTEFRLVNETFNDMIENIKSLKIDVYEAKMQRQKAELLQQKTELQYMKLQVNPHFYINCLNVIHNFSIMNKNDLICDMAAYLGNHLRYTMEGTTLDHLHREVEYVNNYLHIQELRYGDRLRANIEIEDSVKEVMVPPLILQTFVENTVKYQAAADRFTEIYIIAQWCKDMEEHRIRIEIWDNGEGFKKQILCLLKEDKKIYDERGEHYGIRNIVTRLHLIYKGKEYIEFQNHWETGGAYIMIEVPADGGIAMITD